MHLNLVTLAFTGPDAGLERRFLHDFFLGSLRQLRIAMVLGAAMYGAYAALDYLMFPTQHALWIIRFAIVCPTILAVAVASYGRWFERWMQPALALVIWVSAGGVIWMTVIAAPPASYQYYAGLPVVLIFSYAFIRTRFLWASLTGWLVVAAYHAAILAWTTTPTPILISNGFFLTTFNLVGMATGYGIEYATRRGFFLRQLLAEEQDKLEARVLERTADLTRVNEQLAQAEKLETIGKLAAGVAHDLNNLLSGLVTYPDMLLDELPPTDPMRDDLLQIKESGMRAAAIVSDLLALSRQGTPIRDVVQLNAVVDAYLRSPECHHLQKTHPGVRLEVALAPGLLHVVGAPVQLAKIVMNLLHNAFEANLVAGAVEVATHNRYLDRALEAYERIPEGEYVVLRVTDTGTGIAKDDLRRIFEPFFTKKQLGRSGTGLGMTLIGSALKEHRAFLDLTTAEGEGTTFELYFPATRDELAVAEAAPRLEELRGSERVLVVDDIPEQRAIATKMLRKLGYHVDAVASGELALAHLATARVDILVLDMVMDPGIDGCETYRRILEAHPGQRAIGATGYASSERVAEALRLGVGEYVQKPYTMERLARALRRELAKVAPPPP
jgi:signal transduction histidine kinase/CheY-like chemotaxis protein